MTVLGWTLVALPLACWALVARTRWVGWIVAVVLAACVAGEIGLATRWIHIEERNTLLIAFFPMTVLAIVVGIVAEQRSAGVHRLRAAGGRVAFGVTLSTIYAAFGIVIVPLAALFVMLNGLVSTPSGAEVLPLPTGLVVTANQDLKCGNGSNAVCSRQITVRSAVGLPAATIALRLRDHLLHEHGWHLAPDNTGGGNACRTEGWFLDRRYVCLSMNLRPDDQKQLFLLLEGSDHNPSQG